MSNVVGSFTLRQFEQNGTEFAGFGSLSMLATEFKFAVTDFASNNPNAPVFVCHAKAAGNRLVEIGKAWVKKIKRGEHVGKDFYSFTFDDPSLPAPINVSAYPTRDTGIFEIVWQRPKRGGGDASSQAAISDDEIQF